MRYEITKVGAFINPQAYPRHPSRAMHQHISCPYLPLDNLIEIIKEIRHVLTFAIQQRINDMLDVHLRVIELVHA